jgi:hypothetical protein
MKSITTLFVIFLLGVTLARAQASSSDSTGSAPPVGVAAADSLKSPSDSTASFTDTSSYPLYVAVKVQDVLAAVSVSLAEQTALTSFFINENNVIANEVNGSLTGTALDQMRSQLKAQFQAILSPQELIQYSANRPDSEYALPAAPTDQ